MKQQLTQKELIALYEGAGEPLNSLSETTLCQSCGAPLKKPPVGIAPCPICRAQKDVQRQAKLIGIL
jgi:rubrerythrin